MAIAKALAVGIVSLVASFLSTGSTAMASPAPHTRALQCGVDDPPPSIV